MQNRLQMCSTCLREVEERLAAEHSSPDADFEERAKLAEALSFLQQARQAISEALPRVHSLQPPQGDPPKSI
jgi:hypothetical protein